MIIECVNICDSLGSSGESDRQGMAHDPELIAIVQRARAGDLGAQSELVRRYSRRVQGYLRGIMRDGFAIEDLAQTVWIKIVRRLPSLRDPATFEAWLFTTARNAALDHHRRLQCRPIAVAGELFLLNLPAERSDQVSPDLLDAVDAATRGWTAASRRILQDMIEGTSYQSIAERERLTLGAVKLRVHRIRKLLRTELEAIRAELRKRCA